MLALLNGDPPRLVRDHPRPARGPGQARVRMRLAGICDTDLQLAQGYLGYRGVLGHEFVGEVLESDDARWLGQRVVADINAGCGDCEDCRLGDGHHCPTRTVLGILGRDGALAEQVVVPERCLVAVPASVADERAVFAEPLAAALHVLDAGRVAQGDRAVVLGDGKLGLLIAMVLVGAGAAVTLVGHHPDKLALAAGARSVLEERLDPQRDAAPFVVEATGSARGLALALALVQARGTVVLKTTVASRLELDLAPVVIKEVRVVGSRCGDLARAVRALEAGAIDPTPLVAARYPLDRAEQAMAHAATRGTLKVLVEGTPT